MRKGFFDGAPLSAPSSAAPRSMTAPSPASSRPAPPPGSLRARSAAAYPVRKSSDPGEISAVNAQGFAESHEPPGERAKHPLDRDNAWPPATADPAPRLPSPPALPLRSPGSATGLEVHRAGRSAGGQSPRHRQEPCPRCARQSAVTGLVSLPRAQCGPDHRATPAPPMSTMVRTIQRGATAAGTSLSHSVIRFASWVARACGGARASAGRERDRRAAPRTA